MTTSPQPSATIRLAEVLACLSLATDLGIAQPLEHALRSAVLAMRLADRAGLSDDEKREAFYVVLLRFIGCTADAPQIAEAARDDFAPHHWFTPVDMTKPTELMAAMLSNIGAGLPLLERARALVHGLSVLSRMEGPDAHCEVAVRLASRAHAPQPVLDALGQAFERWDGKGRPHGIQGNEMKRSVRVALVAEEVDSFAGIVGRDAALSVLQRRSGSYHEPALVEMFVEHHAALYADLDGPAVWDLAMSLEPSPHVVIRDDALDDALCAMADFIDLKSRYTRGHSSGTSLLAEDAAKRMGLSTSDVVLARRSALLHDIGRCAVSTGIWDKKGALNEGEREQVRLHAYYAERLLKRSAALAPLGAIGACTHERADGSGYAQKLAGHQIAVVARVVAAADVYHALLQERPHRAAFTRDAAAVELRKESEAGRLDADAVAAVLAAAGHRDRVRRRRAWPAGLSDREVEVLRVIARGHTDKEIAALLGISKKTVGHHVQHIYDKIGCGTRAAATVFAMQHDLVDE